MAEVAAVTALVRALPMWQPWATLVVTGAKRVETRPKAPPSTVLGRRVAVHACLTRDHLHLLGHWPFDHLTALHRPLPLGAIVGSVVVVHARQVTAELAARLLVDDQAEHALGDYAPGRWAWALADPVALDEPVPWRGSQGIFMVPADVAGFVPGPEPQGSLDVA